MANHRTIGVTTEHPMTEEPITHGEILCVAVENIYCKRPCDAKAEDVTNCTLAKNREQVFREKEGAPVTAETIPFGVDSKHHRKIRKMLKKNESMSLGQLGEINVTSHLIDFILGTRPFKSAPYRDE